MNNARGYRLEVYPQRARRLGRGRLRWHVRLVCIANGNTLMHSEAYYQYNGATLQALVLSQAFGVEVKDVTR